MNTEEPDDLTRDYQRASAAEAGTPANATRDAILAEARNAALRRAPAANDSRYLLRAVAGVAVLGVAVLLWRQQDPRMPIDARPPEYTVAEKAESPAAEISAEAAADTTAMSPPAAPPAAPPVAPTATPTAEPPPSAVANNAASERRAQTDADRFGERSRDTLRSAAPAMRSPAAAQSAAEAESTGSLDVSDATALLQATFTPAQQAAITQPASAWLIRDRNGTVLRSGVIAAPDELARIATSATRDFARDVGPWRVLPATTAAGSVVDLHIAELR